MMLLFEIRSAIIMSIWHLSQIRQKEGAAYLDHCFNAEIFNEFKQRIAGEFL